MQCTVSFFKFSPPMKVVGMLLPIFVDNFKGAWSNFFLPKFQRLKKKANIFCHNPCRILQLKHVLFEKDTSVTTYLNHNQAYTCKIRQNDCFLHPNSLADLIEIQNLDFWFDYLASKQGILFW